MQSLTRIVLLASALGGLVLVSCSEQPSSPGDGFNGPTSCAGVSVDPTPAKTSPATLPAVGLGLDTTRYAGEIAVRGTTAYTTSWSVASGAGQQDQRLGRERCLSAARRLAHRERRVHAW